MGKGARCFRGKKEEMSDILLNNDQVGRGDSIYNAYVYFMLYILSNFSPRGGVSLKVDRTTAHDRTVRPLCGRAVGPR